MKNNNRLDFNFDNAPIQSAQPPHPVDRTGSRPASPQGQRRQPGGLLTAEEVRHMGAEADAPKAVSPEAPTAPAPKAEPAAKPKGEYSSAALEMLRRMQIAEAEPAPADPVKPVVVEPSDMGAFLTRKQATVAPAAEEEKPSQPKADDTVAPVVEPAPATDDKAVADKRREKLDSFTLDADAMAAGFESIEEDDAADLEATGVFTTPTEEVEGTRMFDALPTTPADDNYGGSTIVIPEDFVAEDEDNDTDEVIDEYNSVDDAQSISDDLIRRKRKLGFRFIGTAFVAVLLVIIALSDTIFPFGHTAYFVAIGILLAIAALLNLSAFQSVASLFTMKPDVDFAPAMAIIASFIQLGVVAFLGTKGIEASAMIAAAAVVSLAINTLSKRITVSRTLANFELIANEEPKQAAAFIAPPISASILDPKKAGETLILGRRTTVDMKGFIAHSLSPDLYESVSNKINLVIVTAAVIAACSALIMGGTVAMAVSAFAGLCCAGAQIAAAYPSAVLLARACKKLRNNRVMLSGFKAAKDISDANVVALDSDEIFNDECVSLFKFRTFGDVAPDLAFMTAAALTAEGHSPLAGMFNQIAATTGAGMLAADSVIYENSMGLTGWVDEKKTLLGNRMIMESHSIPVPSMDVDRRILKSGKFPLYLAIDDKIAAMFIIGYEADRHMLHRLRRLINTGVTLLVRTVDPNVTADLICSAYGLPTGTVEVMSSDASRVYCDRMAPTENEPALLNADTAYGFTDAYITAFSLHKSATAASVVAIVMTCLMMALCLGLSVMGLTGAVNVFTLLGSYLVTAVITGIAGLICS